MPVKKKRSLDIFSLLSRISTKNIDFYEKLEDHEKKEFQPFVIMRWLTGTRDARQVYFTNELVNRFAFSLAAHKPLLYKLMCVAASGQGQRYQWKKTASRKSASLSMCMQVIKQYYGYNTKEAADVINLLSNDALLEYAEEIGMQKEDLSKLKKELKTRDGKV